VLARLISPVEVLTNVTPVPEKVPVEPPGANVGPTVPTLQKGVPM